MTPSLEVAFARIEAEAVTPHGIARLIRYGNDGPVDVVGQPRGHRLELGRLPHAAGSRAGFPEAWGRGRFETLGEMFFIPAGHKVHAIGERGTQDSIVCEFEAEAVADWFDDDAGWRGERLRGCLDVASPSLRLVLRRLEGEMRAPGFAASAMLDLMMAQTAIELGRAVGGFGNALVSGGLSPWRLRLIDDRLAEPGPAPDLATLASLCGLSVRQMTRGFRVSRGCSIGDHMARLQVRRAKMLLGQDMPIKTVAATLGFTQAAAFTRAFARAAGETPRQFRQRARLH